MHQTKKGNQWHFGMKAHIGVDADSGLVHTVTTTAANEADVEQVADLLHGKEEQVWADSGYRGAQSRVQRDDLRWHIAARPSDIAKLPEGRANAPLQKREHRKASVRAKGEHPLRVIKRQFGLMKVRFRGLQKPGLHRGLETVGAVKPLIKGRPRSDASELFGVSVDIFVHSKGRARSRPRRGAGWRRTAVCEGSRAKVVP